ncbi:MAG: hypothetical protein WBW00_09460, partial [Pseudolabrys sp.]
DETEFSIFVAVDDEIAPAREVISSTMSASKVFRSSAFRSMCYSSRATNGCWSNALVGPACMAFLAAKPTINLNQ